MNIVINLLPAALYLVALIPFSMIKMNRQKVEENQAILSARHNGEQNQ